MLAQILEYFEMTALGRLKACCISPGAAVLVRILEYVQLASPSSFIAGPLVHRTALIAQPRQDVVLAAFCGSRARPCIQAAALLA
jgi:hypothetical protein